MRCLRYVKDGSYMELTLERCEVERLADDHIRHLLKDALAHVGVAS